MDSNARLCLTATRLLILKSETQCSKAEYGIFQISRTEKGWTIQNLLPLTNAFDVNANYISGFQASSIREGASVGYHELYALHQTNT